MSPSRAAQGLALLERLVALYIAAGVAYPQLKSSILSLFSRARRRTS